MLKYIIPSFVMMLITQTVHALQLEKMFIFLDQKKGQEKIRLVNDRNTSIALITSFGDNDNGIGNIFYTPSVTKLDPKQTQTVRFMISPQEKINTEILRLVNFADIPKGTNAPGLSFIIKQQIPLIIHPADLAIEDEPWKFIKATRQGTTVKIHNDSPYVIRLVNNITLLPSKNQQLLDKGFLLANESLMIPYKMSDTEVKITPKSLSGNPIENEHVIKIQ